MSTPLPYNIASADSHATPSSNDGGILESSNGLEVAHFQRDGHQLLQRDRRKLLDKGRVSFVLLHVDADGGPAAGSAGQAEHDSRSIGEENSDALVFGDRLVDRIHVGELIRLGNLPCEHNQS